MTEKIDSATPKFQSIDEAEEYFLARLPKLKLTQEVLEELRQCYIMRKASMRMDTSKGFEWNVQEEAYVTGQINMLERLIQGGQVVTA